MGDDLKAMLMSGDDGAPDTDKVETWAGVVTVRRLTRSEVLHLNTGRELGKVDVAGYERRLVALGMVEPVMTEDDVAIWQTKDRAGGALGVIADKIAELSGLAQGAQKSRVSGAGG